MQMWDSMPTSMISLVVVVEEEGAGAGAGGRCWVKAGSHMLNRVLSTTGALHKGWERKGDSSATVGPRRLAFWVVTR